MIGGAVGGVVAHVPEVGVCDRLVTPLEESPLDSLHALDGRHRIGRHLDCEALEHVVIVAYVLNGRAGTRLRHSFTDTLLDVGVSKGHLTVGTLLKLDDDRGRAFARVSVRRRGVGALRVRRDGGRRTHSRYGESADGNQRHR